MNHGDRTFDPSLGQVPVPVILPFLKKKMRQAFQLVAFFCIRLNFVDVYSSKD